MILAAGLGTRLMPLTKDRPKALVPFRGVPMLERVIRNMGEAGVRYIVVNVHHFADQVTDFLDRLEIPGLQIYISDERKKLMNTGGALLAARDHFNREEAFLVHNVDVFTNLDLTSLIRFHQRGESMVTMAVKHRSTSRSLLFDRRGYLTGWTHNETGEQKMVRKSTGPAEAYGNSCIQMISGEFFDHFTENLPLNLTEMHLDLARNYRIQPYIHNEDYWFDLGRFENYLKAEKAAF
jgi:NDP-sugar pyrophosphorylase family protein